MGIYTEGVSVNDIAEIGYIRVATGEPAAHASFARDIVGLPALPESNGEAWFRTDIRRRTLVFTPHRGEETAIGIVYRKPEDLEAAAERLEQAGTQIEKLDRAACDLLWVRAAYHLRDPSGNLLHLVSSPQHSGIRFFPVRDNGVTGLASVALRSLDTRRDVHFWTTLLGFELRDWLGDVACIGTDTLHHRITLYPSDRPGLLGFDLMVEDFDLIMQNWYFLQQHQIRIVYGPGREPASRSIFIRFEGAEGLYWGFVTDTARIDPASHRARQFAPDMTSLCNWGSEPSETTGLKIKQS